MGIISSWNPQKLLANATAKEATIENCHRGTMTRTMDEHH